MYSGRYPYYMPIHSSTAMASAGNTSSSSVQLLLLVSTCFLLSISQETTNSVAAAAADSPPHPPFSFIFDFTNLSSYSTTDLSFEGDAKVNGKLIDLTCDSFESDSCQGTGRLSYNHPVPLHDDTTLASFSTSFTFEIKVNNSSPYAPGDGMAFFLTSFPSRMPPNSTGGGESLGLISSGAASYGPDQFVAVEFDTFQNTDVDDPSGSHIGIDINSVHSRNTTNLPMVASLDNMTATIKFDNITRTLVASLELGSNPEPIVLTYQLPDLRTLLPREVAVGFSASTGTSAERHQILAWSFNSTRAPAIPPKGHDKTAMIIIGGAVGLVLLVVMAWLILSCWKWTNRNRTFENQGRKQGPTRFTYQDLAAATDNFSEERKLGKGFFGVVYSGYLKKLRCDVAVKEILNKPNVVPGPGPNNCHFYAELNAITLVKHKNLVKLFGWCTGNSCNFVDFMCWCWKNKNTKLFLVYELVPKGNLHDNLHKEETLPWETRYKIVKDITSALLYLHHECDPFILHRDIKPSNILLNDNFNAKVADFGLSRIADSQNSKILTIPVGTDDYLDPQCKKPEGKVEFSRSSDVYSFGIVLLEIASGKQGSMLLREQVWQQYINRSLLKATDDKLKGEFNISEIESVLILGLWCSYPESNKRPTMEQVVAVLEHSRPLPDLNSLDTIITSSVSTQLELEMPIDPHAPTSAASSSEQMHE